MCISEELLTAHFDRIILYTFCLLFISSCTKVGLAVGDVDSRLKTAFENRIELQVSSVE